MKTRVRTLSALSLMGLLFTLGMAADTDAEKQAMQADLERSLVAPCCWNMTIDHHDSPASREVRQKISEMIDQGKTKAEILAYFTSQPRYGERILASPSQDTLLGKVAYWISGVALVLGAGIVALVLKRVVRPSVAKTKPGESSATIATQQDAPSSWEKQVEDELSKIE
jgi:cytochrome c-type biogenesis protein CcmH